MRSEFWLCACVFIAGCSIERASNPSESDHEAAALSSAAITAVDPISKVDLNNDGKADICGRGGDGVWCALSTGTGFTGATRWTTAFGDAQGWNSPQYYSTIRFPDVDGDGQADICGRSSAGVYCALSTGTSFSDPTFHLWTTDFSDAQGWNSPEYYSTIRFPDVNGDGKADICGRSSVGVSCELSTGTSFGPATFFSAVFSDFNHVNILPYYSTLAFPDVNGDGKADVCGRLTFAVFCALSLGTNFDLAKSWTETFSDDHGWSLSPAYYSTIQFPDMDRDGKADICGRSGGGVLCELSTGSNFGGGTLLASTFSDQNGWNAGPQYYSTIRFPDLNRDDRADVCGRSSNGVECALSLGTSFAGFSFMSGTFSDQNGWNMGPEYYSTIQFADLNDDGRADVCGRSSDGVVCATSSGTNFRGIDFSAVLFSNQNGWHLGPEYYSTIRLP